MSQGLVIHIKKKKEEERLGVGGHHEEHFNNDSNKFLGNTVKREQKV